MTDEKKRWLDEPKNVDKLWRLLCGICGLLVVIELIMNRHAHSEDAAWEGWPAFYGVFGFVAFFLIVIAGKHLRKLLMRPEDYYDR